MFFLHTNSNGRAGKGGIGRNFQRASRDYLAGILAWKLWLGLGFQDIRIRYKRTVLGPLWITASQAATFVVMGMLFSAVLHNDVRNYLPYLAIGMVTWNFMASMILEGPRIFVDSHHIINAMRMPLTIHILRSLVRNVVVYGHNLVAAVGAYFILGGKLTSMVLLLLVTLPLLIASVFAGSLFLAVLGARFRDLGPSVGVATQMMFFVTPIMWRQEDLPLANKWWVTINPAHHLLEVVRAPLLGLVPASQSIMVAVAVAVALNLVAWVVFCASHRRIPYWL